MEKVVKTSKSTLTNFLTILYVAIGFTFLLSLYNCQAEKQVDVMETYFNKNEKQVDDLIANLTSFGMADGEKNKKDSLKTALVLYKKGEYSNSRKVLSEYLTRYGEDTNARYYLGLSFMNMGKYADALKQFVSVETDSEFTERHWLKYNMALCFSSQGDPASKKEAGRILKGILNDPNFTDDTRQAIESMIESFNS